MSKKFSSVILFSDFRFKIFDSYVQTVPLSIRITRPALIGRTLTVTRLLFIIPAITSISIVLVQVS